MIVSASYRTDIPAFYTDWFRHRLKAGYALVRNPYGGQLHRVDLRREAVDGFVFWTRNAGPFMATLDEIAAAGTPFTVQFTITGYPRVLENSVVDTNRAIEQIHALAGLYGPRAVVWRYDPVLITDQTNKEWHTEQFERVASQLSGLVDEVVFSFAHIYRKSRTNLDRAAQKHGFEWHDPNDEQKTALLTRLADIARGHKLRPTLCAQSGLLVSPLTPARCIDVERLSDIAGQPISAKTKGNREGCLCAESRDIGAYDTCPHGCVYCYAVRTPDLAKSRYKSHDLKDESLVA